MNREEQVAVLQRLEGLFQVETEKWQESGAWYMKESGVNLPR